MILRLLPLLILTFVASSCGSSTAPADDDDPDPTETIGSEGGQATVEGATLTIPPGALAQPTAITPPGFATRHTSSTARSWSVL